MTVVDSLYKHASGTRNSRHAYIERHIKPTSVLLLKVTCAEMSAMGPQAWC